MVSETSSGTFRDRFLETFGVSKLRSFGDDFGDDIWNFSGSTFEKFDINFRRRNFNEDDRVMTLKLKIEHRNIFFSESAFACAGACGFHFLTK